jgi:hypothetical protein
MVPAVIVDLVQVPGNTRQTLIDEVGSFDSYGAASGKMLATSAPNRSCEAIGPRTSSSVMADAASAAVGVAEQA